MLDYGVRYARAYGLRYTILRYFNAAGADPDRELTEMHEPEPHLIPRVIAAALGSLSTVEVYGTDYDIVDGTAERRRRSISVPERGTRCDKLFRQSSIQAGEKNRLRTFPGAPATPRS